MKVGSDQIRSRRRMWKYTAHPWHWRRRRRVQRPGYAHLICLECVSRMQAPARWPIFFLVKRNELHPGQSPGGELGELPTACHDNPCRCQNDPGLHQNSLNASRLAWSGAGQRYSTRLKFDICCTTSSSSLLCLCFCLACISALVPAFLPLSFIIRKAINVFMSSSCQIMSC